MSKIIDISPQQATNAPLTKLAVHTDSINAVALSKSDGDKYKVVIATDDDKEYAFTFNSEDEAHTYYTFVLKALK